MTRSLPRRLAYRRRERPCREYGRTGWGRADPRLHAHIPEEIRLARAALADEERRIANFVGFIGDGKGTAALAEALRSAENKALEAREQLRTLEGTAADVFATPPVEWVAERLVKLQEVLERETAPSALLLRRILGPIRLIPVTPQVGRPYYQAETALQVLELIQDPGGVRIYCVGGGGGNRTHVRKPSAAGVYVDSRSTLLLLAARYSDRQDHRAASLKSLAPPLRPGSEPATRI